MASVNKHSLVGDGGKIAPWLPYKRTTSALEGFSAVVMAGGAGVRLRPFTDKLPKPMLPIGGRPLLALIIEQLRNAGARCVYLTTHYRAQAIVEYFGDGDQFGIDIRYLNEEQPLGTAGALALLNDAADPLLVMNGDLLTQVDFCSLFAFHRTQGADMTVVVRQQEFVVPYGVLETNGVAITTIEEKPTLHYTISAGIYVVSMSARHYIPKRQHFDIPDLIRTLLLAERRVVGFPLPGYWLDIGRPGDYQKAQDDLSTGNLLP